LVSKIAGILVALLLAAVWPATQAAAEEITVAAAADLMFAFHDIAAGFQKTTGNTVKLSFGSSGDFFSQIQNGAPYDLFFSAYASYPRRLGRLLEPGTLYEYAIGRIVVWVPNDSRLDLSRGPQVLLDSKIGKIAIANPEHAPYGKAAVAAMRHADVYDKVIGKLVYGENIAQTAQFVQSGNADVGILALSLALAPSMKEKGRYFIIPLSAYPSLSQAGAVLKSSHKKREARQFLDFLREPEAVEIMARYGFLAPGKPLPESANH
jgi:molybdate transport system substrate-binding protein